MSLNVYLSGEIHTDWREQIIDGAKGMDVSFSSAVTDHDASDDCGVAILGAEDRLTTAAGGAAMQRLNPNLHMDVFPKTAHLPFLSQAERLASKLINFLDFFD